MDVGEDGKTGFAGYGAEDAAAFDEARAAVAANAGAVGFVVASFEDEGDFEIGGDALDGGGEGAGVGFGFEDAGAGDEEETASADFDGAEVEGICGCGHMSYLTIAASAAGQGHCGPAAAGVLGFGDCGAFGFYFREHLVDGILS